MTDDRSEDVTTPADEPNEDVEVIASEIEETRAFEDACKQTGLSAARSRRSASGSTRRTSFRTPRRPCARRR